MTASIPPTPPATKSRRRIAVWLALALALMVTLLALAATATWMLRTTAGLQVLIGVAHMQARDVRGTLMDGFSIEHLSLRSGSGVVSVTAIEVSPIEWRLDFKAPRILTLRIASAQARDVLITRPAVRPLGTPPSHLTFPATVELPKIAVARWAVEREEPRAVKPWFDLHDIDSAVTLGHGIEVHHFNALLAGNRLTLTGAIEGTRPFALELGGTLTSRLHLGNPTTTPAAPLQLTWRATDTLERISLYAGASGGTHPTARGSLRAQLLPYEAQPLQSLSADLEGLDPSAWWPGAPQAILQLSAQLHTRNEQAFALSGPMVLSNQTPGPVNRKRLPLRTLAANLAVDMNSATLSDMNLALGGGGRTSGSISGALSVGLAPEPHWRTQIELNAVDLSAIHDRIQPLVVSGPVSAFNEGTGARVQADVRTGPRAHIAAQLTVDLAVDDKELVLHQGLLQLGQGSARASGSWTHTGPQAFALTGTLNELDPAHLLRTLDARQPTRLNGELKLEGRLKPNPQAQLRLNLTRSTLLGQPMHGQVALDLHPDESIGVEAALALRNATLNASGSLSGTHGQSTSSILLTLDAAQLADLGLPAQGHLKAQARIGGAWRTPAIEASATAQGLRIGEQNIERLAATLHTRGDAQGTLALHVDVQGHQHPRGAAFSVTQAALDVQGTLPQMRVDLSAHNGAGTALTLQASGGRIKDSNAWQGTVDALRLDGAVNAQLKTAAPLLLAPDHAALGPLSVSALDGRFDEVNLDIRRGRPETHFQTQGRFENIRIAASGTGDEPRLTLQGRWSLRTTDVLDGTLHIERASGDVFSGPPTRRARMGLEDLRLDATVRAHRLNISGALRGSAVGTLNAALQAELEHSDPAPTWRLARHRPWSGALVGTAPSLEWINPFLSVNLRDNIRVGGSADLDIKLTGTPQAPIARGHINADALRVAWVEQGVRLDNGILRAQLATTAQGGTELIVQELRFSGQPRVRPQDRRINAALADLPEGSLSASGKVSLPALEGLVQVRSERFPVLQRPDRWAIATGGANIVFSPRRVALTGAVRTDAGYIDITRRELPTLSGDVVVSHASTHGTAAKPEPRVPLDFALGIDLGPAFIVRGAGLDARVEGALQLKHEGRGVIRATGAIETHNGTYEGFGQKLTIERGRLNFQGAVDNPGLDILALRKNLPVEVGVTITRSAANPLVRLYSDPPMADFETLSWLALGRPAENTRNDSTALARAALGLLSGSGEGVPTQLARRLGIDELSIRGADSGNAASLLPRQSAAGRVRGEVSTVSGEIVAIGKRLSDNLTLTYETATSGTGNTVQLSYQLTRRLSLIGRAGTESTLDLVYGFAFD